MKTDKILYDLIRKNNFVQKIIPEAASRKIEKCRFLSAYEKGKIYEPVFDYNSDNHNFKKMIIALDNLRFTKDFIGKLLEEKSSEMRIKAEFASTNRTTNDEFTQFSEKIFGKPDKKIIKRAMSLLETEPQVKEHEKRISQDMIFHHINQVLKDYGITGWKIETIGNTAYSVSVFPFEKKIRVNSESIYRKHSLERMIVHEIGSHVLRTFNGRKQEYKICTYGFPYYCFTEEGTAILNEHRHGLLDKFRLRDYAGRLMAVDFALHGSFYDTFINLISNGFEKEHAYTMTFRVRCGLSDQSLPGAYTRDWIYFGGFSKLKKLVESKEIQFNDLLLYGKTSYKYLNEYISFQNFLT